MSYIALPHIDCLVSANIRDQPPRVVSTIVDPRMRDFAIPTGSLSLSGVVTVGSTPSARIVNAYDRETDVFVATTTSAGDGTYTIPGLAARTDGYNVQLRGVVASGERDVWVPGVHPA